MNIPPGFIDTVLSTLLLFAAGVLIVGWVAREVLAEVRYRRLFDRHPLDGHLIREPRALESRRPLELEAAPTRLEIRP